MPEVSETALRHTGTAVLKTRRLVLRPFTLGDAPAMYRNWASDPAVTRFLTWPAHTSQGVSARVLAMWVPRYGEEVYYNWAIVFEGEAVGNISVVSLNEERAGCEVGYCLSPRLWGRGLMTEALAAVAAHLFTAVGLHKISAFHDVNNPASGRVMAKCGMKQEGLLREELRRSDGAWADVVLYGLLRREWEEAAGAETAPGEK